ncbi:MAG TPA: hypothetical protein VHJ20_07880 [Polyangia bacterium]|nr:hypothetical protein [Polyangia bacterium]
MDWGPQSTSARRAGAVALAAAALVACTRNPYVVGAICPATAGGGAGVVPPSCAGGGGGSPGVTFAADLDRSGVSFLDGALALPSGPMAPALRLRGESATTAAWPAEVGGTFAWKSGATGVEAPFTDGTRAVETFLSEVTFTAPSAAVGALGNDDVVFEVVLRGAAGATVASKSGAGGGWRFASDGTGALALTLDDGTGHVVHVTSEPLVPNAWAHCLFWASRGGAARADCDGRMGVTSAAPALGALDVPGTTMAIGGGEDVEIALLAIYRAPAGGLGDASGWLAIGRRRFAQLTGAAPRIAGGTALPAAGLRASAAWVDLQASAGAPRRLFLVGPDWPRIACRTDVAGARGCGFLSEPDRARLVPAEPSAWTADGLSVAAPAGVSAAFADGTSSMAGLVPTTDSSPHALSTTAAVGPAREVLSFFARAGASSFVGASAGTSARAIFDVGAGKVVSAPANVRATIEPWGAGIFRCAYAFDAAMGATTYTVEVLAGADGAPFVGDGATTSAFVTGLQLDVNVNYPGSPLAATAQAADQLTFVGDDGNLPTSSAVAISLRTQLAAGPRLTDQALVNLNRGGSYDDQVQLYVTGDKGQIGFWGISGKVTHWAFDHPALVADGATHAVLADWNATLAHVAVDGAPAMEMALVPNQSFGLDRIDVGFSGHSSGALGGLVSALEIAAK